MIIVTNVYGKEFVWRYFSSYVNMLFKEGITTGSLFSITNGKKAYLYYQDKNVGYVLFLEKK